MWLEMRKFFAYSAWFQFCISVKAKQLKLELFKLFSLNLKQCLKLSWLRHDSGQKQVVRHLTC